MKLKFLSSLLIILFTQTGYSVSLNFLHAVSGCYGGQVSPNNCYISKASSFSGRVFKVSGQLRRLGVPEADNEITAMGTTGVFMYAASTTDNIYKSYITTGIYWAKVVSKLGSYIHCMTNSTSNTDPLYFGTIGGDVYELDADRTLIKIAHLDTPITAIALDTDTKNVYFGTNSGATYLYNKGLPGIVTLTGIPTGSASEVSALSINTYKKVAIAGVGNRIYILNIPQQKWLLSDKLPYPVSDVLGVYNSGLIYAATYGGHVYQHDLSSSRSDWTDMGMPGGRMPIASLFGFDSSHVGFINYDENVYSVWNNKWVYEGQLK